MQARNFKEHLFYRTLPGDCFCVLNWIRSLNCLHSKIKQTLYCLLLSFPISPLLDFFQQKNPLLFLKDFLLVFFQRKWELMNNKDFVFATKQHFLLSVNNVDSLAR